MSKMVADLSVVTTVRPRAGRVEGGIAHRMCEMLLLHHDAEAALPQMSWWISTGCAAAWHRYAGLGQFGVFSKLSP